MMTTPPYPPGYDLEIHDQLPSVEEYRTTVMSSHQATDPMREVHLSNSFEDGNHNKTMEVDEGSHDQLPSVEDIKIRALGLDTRTVEERLKERRKSALIMCCVLLFWTAVVVVGVVFSTKRNQTSNLSSGNERGIGGSGLGGGSTSPLGADRHSKVQAYLTYLGISSASDLMTPDTPQYKASLWLANFDEAALLIPPYKKTGRVSSTDVHHNTFVERYVMAVLYFSLGGSDSWKFQLKFLTKGHVCNWFELFGARPGTVFKIGIHECISTDDGNFVESIFIPANILKGKIPEEIMYLNELDTLAIPFNPDVIGQLPSTMKNMANLKSLELQYCSLGGLPIPGWIGDLTQLEILGLGNNLFVGELPTSIQLLTNLQMLGVDDNVNLVGNLDLFASMTKLKQLYLEDNSITGTLTSDLLNSWENMEELDLSGNSIASDIPDNLFSHPKLVVVDLNSNHFKGTLPEVTDPNYALEFVALYNNRLEGTVPESIQNMVLLAHLDVSRNKFELPIPDTLTELTQLRSLHIGDNQYSNQPIPSFIGQMTKLRELSMKSSSLTGTIPQWLGQNLTKMMLLDLDSNHLTGSLPTTLAEMTLLKNLLLNRNRLTGTIPPSFRKMTTLDLFLLDKNQINGTAHVMCNAKDMKIKDFSSDCAPRGGGMIKLNCTCCTICCHDGDESCNNLEWSSNLDPIWEYGYGRRVYQFSQDVVPIDDSDVETGGANNTEP